jgi:hypothetical protein
MADEMDDTAMPAGDGMTDGMDMEKKDGGTDGGEGAGTEDPA